jgi:uncharacterized protein YlxW (UPF0749 family)
MKISRIIAITIICIILGIMIAWQYKSTNYNQSLISFENKRTEELKNDLIILQKRNNELSDTLKKLSEDYKLLEKSMTNDSDLAKYYKRKLEEAKIFAGFVDVKGKGLIVTINSSEYTRVHEEDVLDVVNELRSAGAQAISVNEERIVAMSEIRQAGKYIMINGRQMAAPFEIKAISDPGELERALMLINGVVERLENWQLKITVNKVDEIIIPAIREDSPVIKMDLLVPVE